MKIGFVGAGQMASAMAKGFVQAGIVEACNVILTDPYAPALEALAREGFKVTSSGKEVVEGCDPIIIAVKPHAVKSALENLREELDGKLLISVAAGLNLAYYAKILGDTQRVIRVMPNTPCLVLKSATGWVASAGCFPEDHKTVQTLFSAVGYCVQVEEKLMEAVVAVSGSGPAYYYLMISALADAGVRNGLPRDAAIKLAAQTCVGAGEMVLSTGRHPDELKDQVCSPGGTTIEGVVALEENGFRHAVITAAQASHDKAKKIEG